MSERTRVDAVMVAVVVGAPALMLGGVPGWSVPLSCGAAAMALGLYVRGRKARGEALRLPRGGWVFAFAALWTLVALLPMPGAVLDFVSPDAHALSSRSYELAGMGEPSRISVLPGATTLDLGRVLVLLAAFYLGSFARWREVCRVVVGVSVLVLAIGLLQLAFDSQRLLGLYTPVDTSPFRDSRWGLLTTFINPNHLGAFFILAASCSVALLVDGHERNAASRDGRMLLGIVLALQILGIALTRSRGALACTLGAGLVAAILYLRARRGSDAPKSLAPLLLGVVIAGLLAFGGRQAFFDLSSLAQDDAFSLKYDSVRESLVLALHAPLFGIGRGATVDLLPTVYDHGGALLFTHIECAPVAMLVEWGIVGGVVILAGLGLLWFRALRHKRSLSRLMLFLGLAVVAVQNLADFNWAYLGVAAPMAALAGSLTPREREPDEPGNTRRLLALTVALGLATLATAFASGRNFTELRRQDDRVLAGQLSVQDALASRPLDSRVHLVLARQAFGEGRTDAATDHAEFSAQLAPWSVDARLLLHRLYTQAQRPADARRVLGEALAVVGPEQQAPLVDYLCTGLSAPDLRGLPGLSDTVLEALGPKLLESCPTHLDALAEEPSRAAPPPLIALELRTRANLALERPLLARYFARQWMAEAPGAARAHEAWTDTLRLDADQDAAAVEVAVRRHLAQALRTSDLDDPAHLEELLLWSLKRSASPAELANALDRVAPKLLSRSSTRETRLRRRKLVDELEALRSN